SGGSTENWLPPLASRWSRWFRPLKLRLSVGFVVARRLDATTGASRGFFGNLPFLNPGRGRLKLPAPSSSSTPGENSGAWMASAPGAAGRMLVVPPLGICRVPDPGAAPAVPATVGIAPATPNRSALPMTTHRLFMVPPWTRGAPARGTRFFGGSRTNERDEPPMPRTGRLVPGSEAFRGPSAHPGV